MWTVGSVVDFHLCGRCFDLQSGKSRYTLLMRTNKVETAVQCFRTSHSSVCLIFWSWQFNSLNMELIYPLASHRWQCQKLHRHDGRHGVQSQVESYQKSKNWYLMPPCLTLSVIRYRSRVKWSNPRKRVATFPTPYCSSYRKGSLRVTPDYGRQVYIYYSSNSFFEETICLQYLFHISSVYWVKFFKKIYEQQSCLKPFCP